MANVSAVRHVLKACSDAQYQAAFADPSVVKLDAISKRPNITLRFLLDSMPARLAMSKASRDFVHFAASVYVLDEICARQDSVDSWSRSFELIFPVDDSGTWARETAGISRMLNFLTGDSWGLSCPGRSSIPPGRRSRKRVGGQFDTVCLFSGGMDSLIGSHQLLAAGKRVMLVGHYADGVTAAAQKSLASALVARFGDLVHFVQVRMARAAICDPEFPLPKKLEETHRPRSFLFLALAAAVAESTKAKEIAIPENGLIALNVPLETSRIGSLSTRTAHPKFLVGFADVVQNLGVFNGRLLNPFIYESKTDMVKSAAGPVLDLLAKTISCARPSRNLGAGVRHCGYCVPCLYRRAAFAEVGRDDSGQYAFDAFGSPTSLSVRRRHDYLALVRFAYQVVGASEQELQLRVTSNGWFPPSVGGRFGVASFGDYSPWAKMLRWWSESFIQLATKLCPRSDRKRAGIATP